MTSQANTTKDDLEKEKLELEVRDMKRHWALKNFPSVATVVVTLFGGVYALYTGLFDIERRSLELQKEQLQHDIREFTVTKDSLMQTNASLVARSQALLDTSLAYRQQVDEIRETAKRSQAELERLRARYRPVNDPKAQAMLDSMMNILLAPVPTLEEELELIRKEDSLKNATHR